MSSNTRNAFDPEKAFGPFLESLENQDDAAWNWLLGHFREKVIPYIRKIDGRLSKEAIISVDYFVEEIFSNSLIKFYELFVKGEFESLAQLRGLIFRISEIKLKEAYKQVKKDQLFYFSPPPTVNTEKQEDYFELNEKELEQQDAIRKMQVVLKELPASDREVLLRFAKGERLKSIAKALSIDEPNCRKKQQRALLKMRRLLK